MPSSSRTPIVAKSGRYLGSFALFFLLGVPSAKAQTSYVWNGSSNTNWFTGTNWTPNGPPTSADSANINSSTGPVIGSGGATANGTFVGTAGTGMLIIHSGGSLTDTFAILGNC